MNNKTLSKKATKGFVTRSLENTQDSLNHHLGQEAKDFISGAKPKFPTDLGTTPSKQYQPRAPRKIPFNLRMDENIRAIIEKIAEAEDRSLHWVTEQILKEGIRKRAIDNGIKVDF